MASKPQEIDGYIITGLLGSGDFADTYRARRDEQEVAIKLSKVSAGDAAERLRHEQYVLPLFGHPNLPKALGGGTWNDRPYLIMSLAPGRTLRNIWRENIERNGRASDREVLLLAKQLLSALVHLTETDHADGSGWVHRDIKDANVLATSGFELVTLIDFGFCKENAASDRRLDDSFFRAGAARYAPPSKLDYPSTALVSHDVFAVGVLCYQMLTNEFPWSVAQGRGELTDLMRRERPVSISDLNNAVRREVVKFVESLIEIKDEYRPSAKDAVRRAEELLEPVAAALVRASAAPLRFPDVWRDPVRGDVRLTAFERKIIDTKEMQRLREIKQLGLSYFVYDGARHSRLGHAVGCLQRVEDILHNLEQVEGLRIDNETREATRLYALCHDVTHMPLGHTLEDEYGFFRRHDENTERISRLLFDSSSDIGRLLHGSGPGREVLRHFDLTVSARSRADIEELVSGPVGADVLDYIDRDAYFCGLSHRVDSALLRQLRLAAFRGTEESHVVSLVHGSYGLRADREYAVESLFNERYALFLKVYNHKTKIKASALVGKALALALHAGRRPALLERDLEVLSDAELLDRVGSARKQNERESVLLDQLRRRQLPDAVYRGPLLGEDALSPEAHSARKAELKGSGPLGLFPAERRLQVEEELARSSGLRPDQVFVYATPSAPGFKRTQNHKFLVTADGRTTTPSQSWFAQIQRRHLRLWDIWVLVDPSADLHARTRLADASEYRFGLHNRIDVLPRTDALF